MPFKFFIAVLLSATYTINALAQPLSYQCDENIENLRQDLISMLNKIAAMPSIANIYSASRGKYEDLKKMRDAGDYYSCATESDRVLQITKPYGKR